MPAVTVQSKARLTARVFSVSLIVLEFFGIAWGLVIYYLPVSCAIQGLPPSSCAASGLDLESFLPITTGIVLSGVGYIYFVRIKEKTDNLRG